MSEWKKSWLFYSLIVIISVLAVIFVFPTASIKEPVVYPVMIKVGSWIGSGVFVDDDLVLTAGHVVERSDGWCVVKVPDGNEYDGKVVCVDDDSDLALVLVRTKRIEPRIKVINTRVGMYITMVGCPTGIWPPVQTFGRVISNKRDMSRYKAGWNNAVITDISGAGGSSGSGVFYKGRLCGIHVGSIGYSGIRIMVHPDSVRRFISQYKGLE